MMHSSSSTGSTSCRTLDTVGGAARGCWRSEHSIRRKDASARGENAGSVASGSRLHAGPPRCVAPATRRHRHLEGSEQTVRVLAIQDQERDCRTRHLTPPIASSGAFLAPPSEHTSSRSMLGYY